MARGNTEIGSLPKLPSSWCWAEAQDLCVKEITSGNTPEKNLMFPDCGEIPFLKVYNLTTDGALDFSNKPTFVSRLTHQNNLKRSQLKPGDVLMNIVGPPLGKVSIVPDTYPEWNMNQAIVVFRPFPEISNKFVCYALLTERIHSWATNQSKATAGQFNVRTTACRSLPLPLPPVNEQRRIVAKIEDLSARSRAAKEALDAIPPLLERFRQSVLAAAFRGDLTKQWREQNPNVEPASVLLDRIRQERRQRWEQDYVAQQKAKGKTPKDGKWKEKYQEPEPVDITGLPGLPSGWCWVKVDEIAAVKTGATPLRSNRDFYHGGTIPWVTSGALNSDFVEKETAFVTETALAQTNLSLIPAHSLLVAMYGEGKTRGLCSELMFNAATNQAIAALVFENTSFKVRHWVRYFFKLNYEKIRMASSGGVQPNLNLKRVKEQFFSLAPLEEQAEAVRLLDHYFGQIDALGRTLGVVQDRARALSQSILAKAFRGELVPQDPNDEPASALLERIRADRANNESKGTGRKRSKS